MELDRKEGRKMEKKYDVLEFYKIINELINLSKLEKTKEKFIDTDIIKNFFPIISFLYVYTIFNI